MADYSFFRRGGSDQLRIEKPEDLAAIETLDQKLWVALSMPVFGQELDSRTLSLLDTDGDGRIRAPEIIAAVKFARENLAKFDGFFAGSGSVALDAIAAESPLAGTAKEILSRLGKDGADALALEDVEHATKTFDAQPFNGDGVIVPASAGEDSALAAFIADAVSATGGTPDASGENGVTAEQAAAFSANAAAVVAWREKAAANPEILPLGEKTVAAFAAFSAIRAKTEDFFARVRLASFDAAAEARLNPTPDDFSALAGTEISASASAAFPLARVAATSGEPALPLSSGVNPAWRGKLDAFVENALVPALEKLGGNVSSGKPETLTASRWAQVSALFAPHEAWLAERPDAGAAAFPTERLREIVSGNFPEKLAPLFEKDAAEKPLRDSLAAAEKLCRCSRDLAVILRNFVSFAEFYKRDADKTAFLVGRLYMDSRTCSFCVRVADAGAHSALAAKSNCCLAYCECTRKNGEKMTIVAMFGDGDAYSLYVGRNGIFYDKQGDDWDAKIVKIVENPISIRQAFWTPYRKVAKFVESQVENFAAAREKKVDGDLSSGAGTALTNATTAPAAGAGTPSGAAAKPAFDIAKFAGIFAAAGLALGAIGAALTAALTGFLRLAPWQMALVVVAVILIISAPSMLIAAMKLRRRSLDPILEANGWAINGNVKINIPLGKAFTEMPKKPDGAQISRMDPYQRKPFPFRAKLLVALAAALCAACLLLRFCCAGEEKSAPENAASAPTAQPAAVPASAPTGVPAPSAETPVDASLPS